MNTIHIAPLAKDDLIQIKQYIEIELDNPSAAENTITKIIERIYSLRDHALLGTSLSKNVNIKSDYRYLVANNYLIFYRAYETNIYVDRVLYNRRDYISILFDEYH